MSTDSWDEMKRAKEEAYFEKQNKEALGRLASRSQNKPRLSPITGEPMEQVTYKGIVVDKCNSSGGVWLDAGELEEIIKLAKEDASKKGNYSFEGFFSGLLDVVSGTSKKK